MGITTDSYIDVRDAQSALQDKIGLSKSLDNYTVDEITSYCYCGADNNLIRYPLKRSDVQAFLRDVDIPYHIENTASNYFTFTLGDRTPYADISSIYGRVVWLCDTVNSGANIITSSNAVNFKLITEMKASHYCYEWDAPHTVNVGSTPYGTTDWSGSDMTAHKIWAASGGSLSYYKDFSGGEIIDLSAQHIHPYFLTEIDNKLYCIAVSLDINHYKSNYNMYTIDPNYPPNEGYSYTSWDESDSFDVCYTALQTWDSTFANTGWNFPYTYNRFSAGAYGYPTILQGFEEDNVTGLGIVGGSAYNLDCGWEFNYYFKEREDVYTLLSGCGLYFKTDKIYKPIIQSGYVTGYTDELSTTSDIDTWEGSTNHNIPPTPPTPPPPPIDPWDVDPETYGWSGGEVSGMVKYYLLTAGQMSELQTAMASNANWTIDYLNCIVSCFVVPNSGIFFDAPIPTTVKFKLDKATQWDTGVSCKRIQGTKSKSGGTIDIPRLTNTFYDFEPYSDYSVYIPFCGRVPIKGNVCLGHEIKVTYYPDVPTCSLTAVISCGGATIAIAKGSFGTMTPVTSNGSDRKTAAVIEDVAPIITGIGTGIVGVALGNPLIVGAGAAQALGGIMGGVKETVQSYAYSVGSTGDSSFFSAGNRCYYYANYPLIDEIVEDSMFGHSVGYLCNSVGKLSSFTGFTICANPHVTFSATSEEKEEIERLLSMGVIL